MPAVPLKVVGEDFLANHLTQLLARQPPATRESETPRQLPAKSTRLSSSGSQRWIVTEHVGLRQSRSGSGEASGNARSCSVSESCMEIPPSNQEAPTGERNSFSSISSAESEVRPRSKDGSSEPDLSILNLDRFEGHRHRRTGSDALLSPRISFSTSFGAKPRKSRTRTHTHASVESGAAQLVRNPSVRSGVSSSRSNGSISPLDIYAQSPWAYPMPAKTPPLESVSELATRDQWSAFLCGDALQHSASQLNLRLEAAKTLEESCPDLERDQQATLDDARVNPTTEAPARLRFQRSTTSPSPVSTDLSENSPATPMSHRSPSLPGSLAGENMSRHSSAQRAKLLLVPKGTDGRTFTFIDPESDQDSDGNAEVEQSATTSHVADNASVESEGVVPVAISDGVDPTKAFMALKAAMGRNEPALQSSSPGLDPVLVSEQASTHTGVKLEKSPEVSAPEHIKKPARRMTLLERTMAEERGAKSQTIEILGQKIVRRGVQPQPAPQTRRTSASPSGQPPTPGGYGQEKRTFRLRAVGDSLMALDTAVPVLKPADTERKPSMSEEDRVSRWAREQSTQLRSLDTARTATVEPAMISPTSAAPPSTLCSASKTQAGRTGEPSDYFASWTPQPQDKASRKLSVCPPARSAPRARASFMTSTTSTMSAGTNVSNILHMTPDGDGSEHAPTATPVSSPETPPKATLGPDKCSVAPAAGQDLAAV